MSMSELFSAVFLTAIAVSYGWGMRGCVIGGEKGAMLPGALLGLFISKLSGIPIIADNAFLFSAVSCFAMGYGGFETYAQTMEMVLKPKSDIFNPKKGYSGLMLKGGNWFGICGVILGMSFSALTGSVYGIAEIVAVCLAVPFIQLLGIRIFNKPYDKSESVFPKIYFSRDRREEWGGNLLTLAFLLIVTAVKGDLFAFFFGVTGIVSGAVGWAVSIWLYYITALPLKNGKYIFGSVQEKGFIDNWKIMEFALGFLGGGGLACYFFLRVDYLKNMASGVKLWNPLGKGEEAAAWIMVAVAVAMAVQYFVKGLQKSRAFELLERAVYFSFMLCLVMLGSVQAAKLSVFLLILWVLTEKTVFDRETEKSAVLIKIVFAVVFIAAVICDVLFDIGSSILILMLMYTFYYIFSDVIFTVARPLRGREKCGVDKFKDCILTYIWFLLLSAITVASSIVLF